jgi:hypothetical protein
MGYPCASVSHREGWSRRGGAGFGDVNLPVLADADELMTKAGEQSEIADRPAA